MIREPFRKHLIGMNKEFRYRGEESGRLENFSDSVFALAITLLLISTTPPTTFAEIKRFTYELIPFLLCIALIILIWYQHFEFYYRYGLHGGKMIVLNTLFLVIVLFYVYPLKFLTRLVLIPVSYLFEEDTLLIELQGMIRGKDMGELMIIYGIGAASVFFVLALMYRYALRKADALELNEIEKFDTRVSRNTNVLMGIIPLISILMAMIFQGHWTAGMISGFTYLLYTPVMFIHGSRVEKARKKLLVHLQKKNELDSY